MSVPVYLLAGGRSRRFGRDKARALVDGQPMILAAAAQFDTPVTVVAAQSYDDVGLATIADNFPGRGPIAGLEAALAHCAEEWLLLSSCDLLGLAPSCLEALLVARSEGAEAVVFRDDRWQPMPGLYHRRALPRVRAQLAADRLAMWRLLETLDTVAVEPTPAFEARAQINDPEALARFLAQRRGG